MPVIKLYFCRFPKTFISIIHSALVMNYYSQELEEVCKKIFNLEFVEKFCKNDYYYLNREYLEMNYCLELEQPEYGGPTLDKEIIHYLCKVRRLKKVLHQNPFIDIYIMLSDIWIL